MQRGKEAPDRNKVQPIIKEKEGTTRFFCAGGERRGEGALVIEIEENCKKNGKLGERRGNDKRGLGQNNPFLIEEKGEML